MLVAALSEEDSKAGVPGDWVIIGVGRVDSSYESDPHEEGRVRLDIDPIVPIASLPIPLRNLAADNRVAGVVRDAQSKNHLLTKLGDLEWSAFIDHCSIETLMEIDRLIAPGTLAKVAGTASGWGTEDALTGLYLRRSVEHTQGRSTRFRRLTVAGWRQFSSVDISFDDRLTVLTGANGAGKTSILNLLNPHFQWNAQFISVPYRDSQGRLAYHTGRKDDSSGGPTAAQLEYSGGEIASLAIPDTTGTSFGVGWQGQQPMTGLYIPSHRQIAGYSAVQSMPTTFSAGAAVLESFLNEIRTRYAGGYTGKSAGQWMKESLLAAAFHGLQSGGTDIEANPEAAEIWHGFQVVLRRLLPPSLGFERLVVRAPEVVVVTRHSEFALDAASGGISALMELGWQIFLRSRDQSVFTVCFDEPENHLHPELQRLILPRLLDAFPGVTFVIATHSPFLVTSVPDAAVYALDYDNSGQVSSYRLDFARASNSAEDVLRRVLGVESTLPVWVNFALDQVLEQYQGREMTLETIRELRDRLEGLGVSDQFPATLAALARAGRIEP